MIMIRQLIHFSPTFTITQSSILQTTFGGLQLSTRSLSSKRWHPTDEFSNPILSLQPFATVPLLDPPEGLFNPSLSMIQQSDEMFRPKRGEKVKTYKGAIKSEDLEQLNIPEVCFLGRSNVGKSSLISRLLFHEAHVKVSKKPGHTRVIKQFTIANRFTLVDMPGYGHNMPEHFVDSVENYLLHRQQLCQCFLLVDGKVGLTSTDQLALNMMEQFSKPYTIVLTKIDKAAASTAITHLMEIQKLQETSLMACFPQIFLLSSHADCGISFLRSFIAEITGYLRPN